MLTSDQHTDERPTRRWWRRARRGLLALFLSLTLLAASQTDFRPSDIELAAAPYTYSILSWELSHLSHKWTRKLGGLWPGGGELTREEQVAQVQEFFSLGQQHREIGGKLRRAALSYPGKAAGNSEAGATPPPAVAYLTAVMERNRARRAELLPAVEGIVEAELSRILTEEGLTTRWLGVFPPVDVVFGSPPSMLVLSPRERIYRQQAILVQPDLSDEVKEELEALALESANLSAVVERTGGLSVYPSIVLDTAGLRNALEVVSHEWVHHWLFFRPLGRNFQGSAEMLTLNETAATIAGEELGDRVYTALTGEAVTRPWLRSAPGLFDFNAEMRQTRRRAEELLARGDVTGAEAYMEERRRLFVAAGYNLRKLNQAYFAFHGSYATGPGSLSPVGDQLRELRRRSGSLWQFLETVAQFGSYGEFVDYWEKRE